MLHLFDAVNGIISVKFLLYTLKEKKKKKLQQNWLAICWSDFYFVANKQQNVHRPRNLVTKGYLVWRSYQKILLKFFPLFSLNVLTRKVFDHIKSQLHKKLVGEIIREK